MMILIKRNEHIIIARDCYGIFGMIKIQLVISIKENKKMSKCDNVLVPILMHAIREIKGKVIRIGNMKKIKKFLGSTSKYVHVGSPL